MREEKVMRGSAVKRGNTYSIVFDLGRDQRTGRRKQKWIGGFKTKKEAEAALAQALAEVMRGTYIDPARITAGEWLRSG